MTSVSDRLTREEAVDRAAKVSDVSYVIDLEFEAGAKTFQGDTTISFTHAGGDLFVEFAGGEITRLEVNGSEVDARRDGSRLALPAGMLGERNEVRVVYERLYDKTGEGIHHFIDPVDGGEYIYTQFEPYSAHRVFPCFDQPDLKATYRVSVLAPAAWEVVTASKELDRDEAADGRVRRVFAETQPFSTYLLAVCAGPFHHVHDEHGGVDLGLYCRASLAEHLDPDRLFATTKAGLDFFGEFFDEPYPFGKYDQLFVPEFNWGGMENVAAVTYTDSVVFRDPPTSDELLRRDEYFLHELAHMWFGDLVTMEWWSDLWLNESFASYMAYLALDHTGVTEAWQDFNRRMKLWAYQEDQLPTTHPIADDVPSTDETFLNFDGISYGKGASVLKQLVRAIGEEAFREGMRTYFRRHRFGNASLADFLAALQEGAGIDLVHWAARWLRTASLNTIAVEWEVDGRGTVADFYVEQRALEDHPVLRPHAFDIALVQPSGSVTSAPAAIERARERVRAAEGGVAPALVYPNLGDHGFFKIDLADEGLAWIRGNLDRIGDDLLRQQVWGTVWDLVRDARYPSVDYTALVREVLPGESDLTITKLVTATVGGAVGRYVPDEVIDGEADAFVAVAADALERPSDRDAQAAWIRALLGLVSTPEAARSAADVVEREGLPIDQDMRWAVAIAWSAHDLDGATARLEHERNRDPSDRGERAMATATAARPDRVAKDEVWERLHGGGYPSLHLAMASARGFWRRNQRDLLDPYVERFFDGLPDLFARWEQEAARAYWSNFFPGYLVSDDTRARLRAVIDAGGTNHMLRRLATEADDRLRRAIECRRVAAAALAAATVTEPDEPDVPEVDLT